MLTEALYKEIVKLVAQDRTESAIRTLQQHLEADPNRDPKSYHSVILLISQFNNWENKRRDNLKTDVSELNRINSEILDIAAELARPESKLRVPENYVPPVPPPSPDPLEVAQQPYGHRPFIQKTINTTGTSAKKTNWATPTRILAVVGGLFLLILILTLVFPDEEAPVNDTPNQLTSLSNGEATEPPIPNAASTAFNYEVPTIFPTFDLRTIRNAGFDFSPEAVNFQKQLFGNTQWKFSMTMSGTLAFDETGIYARNVDDNGQSIENVRLQCLGLASDGYFYFQVISNDQLVGLRAVEVYQELKKLRMYQVEQLTEGTAPPYDDYHLR